MISQVKQFIASNGGTLLIVSGMVLWIILVGKFSPSVKVLAYICNCIYLPIAIVRAYFIIRMRRQGVDLSSSLSISWFQEILIVAVATVFLIIGDTTLRLASFTAWSGVVLLCWIIVVVIRYKANAELAE